MACITWDYYDIWYRKRRYQVLIPRDISQFWATQYWNDGQGGMDFDFWGNRKGFEALRNACAVLSQKNNFVVYFPCKKNYSSFLDDYCFGSDLTLTYKFVDFVLMKPGSLKISDWKQIRSRISKMKGRRKSYHFRYEPKTLYKKDNKYEYRKEIPQLFYNYDTIFLNSFSFIYPEMASEVEPFLEPDLEKNFLEDIRRNDGRLRGDAFLWFYGNGWNGWKKGFESGVFFWDDEIYQEAGKAEEIELSGESSGEIKDCFRLP